ncbi:cardiolipin synthase [Carboxylicivirga sp. M1479]|uniref:cardiolipin synthase n=1 Tax=Carboxylicivirga sp. M1479 TaxID=2594476 RepID=UPI0011784D38|nr:cardiolipin synthase [Carboxylicivirga sp. M1479]TRX72145.1 cardiolipin synthase [Carboxylicivirga sp. M1479]
MDFIDSIPPLVINIVKVAYVFAMLAIVFVVMLENRSPLKTIPWMLVLLFVPVLGVVFFVFFGQNLRKEKIIRRKGLKNHDLVREIAHSQSSKLAEGNMDDMSMVANNKKLIQLFLNNSSSILTIGNQVDVLNNGEATFACILDALKNARQSIHLQYYIFDEDEIGNQILDILKEKASKGVEVRMIVDDVGSWELKRPFFKSLQRYGIEIYSFLTVRFPSLTSKVNYRNHRKIVVVDGEIGFLGGLNVADRYIKGNPVYGIWRDMHLRITGDAVNALQSVFFIDWYFVSQKDIADPKYFPPKNPIGDKAVQIVTSGPDSDWPGIMMGYYQAIANARKYVYITTPYFMPGESVLMALKASAMSGVDVRILIPEKSDAYFTALCTKSYIKEMLITGVKFYFYQPGFLHSKMMVVDDELCTIGTTNMDFRSFEQNYEVNAFIFDEEKSIEVKGYFLEDQKQSRCINLDEWKKRPRWQKAKESFARLFSPLL